MNPQKAPFRRSGRSADSWHWVQMPPAAYDQTWQLQKRLIAARRDGSLKRNTVLMLEHLPVFTIGRRGGKENLTVPETFLKKSGIGLIQVERGGSITFHGPGQLVVYPILDLQALGLGVADYVTRLEEVMLRTATAWGIDAGRNPLNRGIWVNLKKMGSIGIAVRRGIAYHGLALNVDLSMEPFSWIHPCGLKGIQATSMALEAGRKVDLPAVRTSLKNDFENVFKIRLETLGLPALLHQLSCNAAVAEEV